MSTLGPAIDNPLSYGSVEAGLPKFITNLIGLAYLIAGLLVLLNFILAAFDLLTASGDPKKVESALNKITQSVLGLFVLAASLAIISILGRALGFNILQPTLYGP